MLLTGLMAAGPIVASVSPEEREALIDLHAATGGEEWTNRDGWLGEPGTECSWYGITCFNERITGIDLPENGLSGTLPTSFGQLSIERLDLAGNDLSGSIDAAVDAMTLEGFIQLDLARNDFSGTIPDSLMALNPVRSRIDSETVASLPSDWSKWTPGFNFCWNALELPDAELTTFIQQHHFGAEFQSCRGARQPVDATFSGSRFYPPRSGEGFVQHLLDNGRVLLFWFTFPLAGDYVGKQAWFLRVAEPDELATLYGGLQRTTGRFGQGGTANLLDQFRLSVDRLPGGVQRISYSRGIDRGGSMAIRLFGIQSITHEQIELTRLAGTTCDNQQPRQWISGAWFDPERSGEGFVVEVNEDGRGLVYWFTHEPGTSGRQAWMIGSGEFDGNTLVIDEVIQPVGARFGAEFNSAHIDYLDWGSLTLAFDDEDSGHIWFESHFEDYGSGDYPIERLARPMLAECGDQEG